MSPFASPRLTSLAAAVVLLLAPVVASAQAVWSGSASINASLSLNGSGNLLGTSTVTINNNTAQTSYYNSGGPGDFWFEFNLTDGDAPGYSSSTGNLRFYLNSQNNSWTTMASNFVTFSFQFPNANSGVVTGFSVISDNRNIAPSFTITNNGSGLITFTQTAPIHFGSSGPAANLIGTFTTTAIPEPSTYAALAGLVALGVVVLRRRRKA